MQRNRPDPEHDVESRADVGTTERRRTVPDSEAVHVRSYDHEWAYDLHVEIATLDGDVVFQQRYYLQPGASRSEVGILPNGEYEIQATLDNEHRESEQCRIDATTDGTVVVEIGNGVLSLTQGLHA
jgi:hypothetical protein